jgi:outer membrane immunogenic protein
MRRVPWVAFIFVNWATVANGAAPSATGWDGWYAGGNLMVNSVSACNQWALQAGMTAIVNARSCAGSSGGGGAQIGENFQYGRVFWGLEATLDVLNSKSVNGSVVYRGTAAPNGTYTFSGKLSPSFLATIAPRIGYAGGEWMAYLKGGALIPAGSNKSDVAYTLAGSTLAAPTFDGGKNFSSVGWVAGGGIELGLYGPWSIGLEYLHSNLGKSSSTSAACSGPVVQCQAFDGLILDNRRNGFTSNVFRLAFNYYFNYW